MKQDNEKGYVSLGNFEYSKLYDNDSREGKGNVAKPISIIPDKNYQEFWESYSIRKKNSKK